MIKPGAKPTMVPIPNSLQTPRIFACLMADNMEKLFPVLAKWSRQDLELLAEDLKKWYQGLERQLTEPAARRALDELHSELSTAVEFYLRQESPEKAQ